MYAKIKYVDGVISYVNIKDSFNLAPVSIMLPEILSAEVFNDKGKRVAVRKRKKQKKYILEYMRQQNYKTTENQQ